MRVTVMTGLVSAAVLLGAMSVPQPARATIAAGAMASGPEAPLVAIEKRKSCWRTNRSTGQKFRVC